MSDFELLSIVLMILAIIVTLMVELFKSMKKVAAPPRNRLLFLKVVHKLGQPSYRQALFSISMVPRSAAFVNGGARC